MSAAVLHLPVSLHPLGEGHVNDNAALGFEAGRYNQAALIPEETQNQSAIGTPPSQVNRQEIENILKREVQALAGKALSTNETFKTITPMLSKTCIAEELQSRHDQWAELHNTFLDLLWESRELAGRAEIVAEDFARVVLDFVQSESIPLGEKKEELRVFKSHVTDQKGVADNFANNFNRLTAKVATFAMEVGVTPDMFDIVLQATIKELDDQISKLTNERNQLKTEAQNLAVTLGIDLTAAGIVGLLACAFEKTWACMVFGGLSCLGVIAGIGIGGYCLVKLWKMLEKGQTIEKLAVERSKLNDELSNALEEAQKSIKDASTKIGAFGDVWARILLDIQAIELHMELATNGPSKRAFLRRIGSLEIKYGLFSEAVREYKETLTRENRIFIRDRQPNNMVQNIDL